MLATYAVYVAVLAVIVLPLIFTVLWSRRVCRGHRWTGIASFSVAAIFSLVALVPFAFFGASWALAWSVLTMPFAVVLEFFASMGYPPFAALTTSVGALFYGAVAYVICALVVKARGQELVNKL